MQEIQIKCYSRFRKDKRRTVSTATQYICTLTFPTSISDNLPSTPLVNSHDPQDDMLYQNSLRQLVKIAQSICSQFSANRQKSLSIKECSLHLPRPDQEWILPIPLAMNLDVELRQGISDLISTVLNDLHAFYTKSFEKTLHQMVSVQEFGIITDDDSVHQVMTMVEATYDRSLHMVRDTVVRSLSREECGETVFRKSSGFSHVSHLLGGHGRSSRQLRSLLVRCQSARGRLLAIHHSIYSRMLSRRQDSWHHTPTSESAPHASPHYTY